MAKEGKTKGPFQKQRANVYTMMLIVAFLALSLGSFLLYKELERYEFEYEPKDKRSRTALVVPVEHEQVIVRIV